MFVNLKLNCLDINLKKYYMSELVTKNDKSKAVYHFLIDKIYFILISIFIFNGLLFSNNALAQSTSNKTVTSDIKLKNITGKVTDNAGIPMPGVTVAVKGTANGTITDINGDYSLSNVAKNAIVQFSFVGMKTQYFTIKDKTTENIVMEVDAIGLNEVVAVGYGTQKKRDVIGSLSTIKSKDIVNPIVTDFNSMLEGKASGVYVSQGTVRIRGMNSISNSTEPLYVIDGIVMANASGLINPNDIESIDVLKDASATAIYGSRASNGVIMITTKSGKSGKSSTTVNLSAGFSQFVNQGFKMADSGTQLDAMDIAIHNAHSYNASIPDLPFNPAVAFSNFIAFGNDQNGNKINYSYFTRDYVKNININLQNAVSQTATFEEANMSTNKSFDKGSIFFSMLGRNETTQYKGNESKKMIARFGVNFMPINNFKFGFNSTMTYYFNQSGISGLSNTWMPFMPLADLTNPTGYWTPAANPIISDNTNYVDNNSNYIRSISNITGEYSIPFLKGLSIKGVAGYDYIAGVANNWSSPFMNASTATTPYVSRANQSTNSSLIMMGNIGLSYSRTFGDHEVSAILYQEAQRSTSYYSYMDAENLSTNFHQISSSPGTLNNMSSGMTQDFRLLSTLGRIGYNYKTRYLIEASLRNDASSKFGPDKQNAVFASIGGGWIISDESFIKDIKWIQLLKLRGSFGQSGNGNMPDFKYLNTYSTDKKYMNLQYSYIQNIGNSAVTWETSNNTDLGIDFGFLNNKINGSAAYYNKDINGLLLQAPLPMSAGIPGGNSIWQNIGRMRNRGVELSLSYVPIRTKDFKWDISFNFSTNSNEVLALNAEADAKGSGILSTNTPTITKSGEKLATFYLPDFAGIDPQKGIAMIYERDATVYANTGKSVRDGNVIPLNSTTGAANLFIQQGKSSMPNWYGGITNDFHYKNFDMNIVIVYTGGSYFINQAAILSRSIGTQMVYGGLIYYDSNGNSSTTGVSPYSGATTQDLTSNDFIRVRFITFGYTLPASLLKAIKLTSLRVYATVSNPFTFSQAPSEINPDLGIPGNLDGNVVNYGLPPIRQYSIGASVSF